MTVVNILLLLLCFAGFCASLYNMFYSIQYHEGIRRFFWVLFNFIFAAWIGLYLVVRITQLI